MCLLFDPNRNKDFDDNDFIVRTADMPLFTITEGADRRQIAAVVIGERECVK